MANLKKLSSRCKIPPQIYLWLAISIFGASSAVTRKLTEIGAQHFIGSRNPISLCNVLFVGNLCALFVLIIIHRQQWNLSNLKRLSRMEWFSLISVAILAGAIAPGLVFQALAFTGVNNVVLVGRLEPPLALALSVWLLREQVNLWEIMGAIVAFMGVVLTIFLQPTMMSIRMSGIGIGELLAATGAIASAISIIIAKKSLSNVPLGIYNVVRTLIGTAIFFLLALVLYGSDHFTDVLSPFLWQWMLAYGISIVVIGQSFWLKGLRHLPVSIVSLVSSFTPIAGIFSAYLILGEVPTKAQYIGGSAILIGIFLSQVGIQHQMAYRRNRLTSVQTDQAIKSTTGFRGI